MDALRGCKQHETTQNIHVEKRHAKRDKSALCVSNGVSDKESRWGLDKETDPFQPVVSPG